MTGNQLYLAVLQGKNVTVKNWYGFYLSGDGEYIHVQGAGSWAHKSDDKTSFLNDLDNFIRQYAQGDINNFEVAV